MEYIKTNGELYHHGVLGQKWGQRNGPPYPLKPGQHSAAEKKAGWTKSISGGDVKKKKHTLKEVAKTTVSVYRDESKNFFKNPKDNLKRTVTHPIKSSIPAQVKERLNNEDEKTGGISRAKLETAEASTRNKTRKSAEEYKKAKQNLQDAKDKRKETRERNFEAQDRKDEKEAYKTSDEFIDSINDVRKARKETRAAEKEVRRQLKAEAGRDLYAKGQTVEKYAKKQFAVGLTSAGADYVAKILAQSGNDKAAVATLVASNAAWIGYNIYAEVQKNKLRAYYAAS